MRAHRPKPGHFAFLLAVTAMAAGIFAGTASASAPSADPAPGPQVTVRIRDASGAITSTWHGSRAAAEPKIAAWRADHAGVVSPDIEQPPHCGLPTTYWVFRADSLVCYRYGGTANINIRNVYEVDSGNNAGYYVVGGTRYYVQKYVTDLWDPKVTVTQIHID